MNNNIVVRGIQCWTIVSVSLAAMVFIALGPTARNGLELLWLLPLTVAICSIIFPNIIAYHKDGIGLKIFYVIIFIRYILSPVLISATNGVTSLDMIHASITGYYFATIVSIIELIVCCLTISICWNKYHPAIQNREPHDEGKWNPGLTIGGLLVIALLSGVILSRGLDGLSSFGFLMLQEQYTINFVDSYSLTAIQVLKSFIFVSVICWTFNNYQKTNNKTWAIVACIVAFFNVTTYFGYNRSIILQTALASIFTLYIAFPKIKQIITIVLVPVVVAVLFSIITLKQFGTSSEDVELLELLFNENLSNIIESYVNGMWPLASSFDAANAMSHQISFLTLPKDIIDNLFFMKIPQLLWLDELLSVIPSTAQLYGLYTIEGAMLPIAGQMWFYGGFVFGPILIIAANVVVIYLLVRFEILSKTQQNFQLVFLYMWLAALFGLMMCYSLMILWWCVSKFAFFLVILYWINNKFVLKKSIVV